MIKNHFYTFFSSNLFLFFNKKIKPEFLLLLFWKKKKARNQKINFFSFLYNIYMYAHAHTRHFTTEKKYWQIEIEGENILYFLQPTIYTRFIMP